MRKLTCGLAASPDWAPNGRRLIFERYGRGLAIMRADGSRRRSIPITDEPPFGVGYDPSFSPDGHHLVFTRSLPPGPDGAEPMSVWLATVNGGESRHLRAGWLPRWSPDGRAIAYVDPDQNTWLMNAKTGKRIRPIAPKVGSMDWSPNSRRIVYASHACCPDVDADLWVTRADGKGDARQLTRTPRWIESEPVWSPDGRRIAFARTHYIASTGYELAKFEVWTMNTAGRHRERIYAVTELEEEFYGFELSWQPRPG
jgi:Tol biopolymer transport system component